MHTPEETPIPESFEEFKPYGKVVDGKPEDPVEVVFEILNRAGFGYDEDGNLIGYDWKQTYRLTPTDSLSWLLLMEKIVTPIGECCEPGPAYLKWLHHLRKATALGEIGAG